VKWICSNDLKQRDRDTPHTHTHAHTHTHTHTHACTHTHTHTAAKVSSADTYSLKVQKSKGLGSGWIKIYDMIWHYTIFKYLNITYTHTYTYKPRLPLETRTLARLPNTLRDVSSLRFQYIYNIQKHTHKKITHIFQWWETQRFNFCAAAHETPRFPFSVSLLSLTLYIYTYILD
jgi:hypothetical protein